MRRLFAALLCFRCTGFAWRGARPLGGWCTRADRDGNVRIVPGAFR